MLIHNNLIEIYKNNRNEKNITEDAVAQRHGLTQEANTQPDTEKLMFSSLF